MPIFQITDWDISFDTFKHEWLIFKVETMSYDSSNELNTNFINDGETFSSDDDSVASTKMNKEDQKEADTHCQLRKRIETLVEKKRLKELLDDSEDW